MSSNGMSVMSFNQKVHTHYYTLILHVDLLTLFSTFSMSDSLIGQAVIEGKRSEGELLCTSVMAVFLASRSASLMPTITKKEMITQAWITFRSQSVFCRSSSDILWQVLIRQC